MMNTLWTLLIFVPLLSEYFVNGQRVNKPPYFVPGSGDMARFSLPENTPIDSPVYQLRGKFTQLKLAMHFSLKLFVKSIRFVFLHRNLISLVIPY